MAQILVRNVSDHAKSRLQERAKRHKRSMEAEVREIINEKLAEENAPTSGFAAQTIALFSGRGLHLDEPIEEWRGYSAEPIQFKG